MSGYPSSINSLMDEQGLILTEALNTDAQTAISLSATNQADIVVLQETALQLAGDPATYTGLPATNLVIDGTVNGINIGNLNTQVQDHSTRINNLEVDVATLQATQFAPLGTAQGDLSMNTYNIIGASSITTSATSEDITQSINPTTLDLEFKKSSGDFASIKCDVMNSATIETGSIDATTINATNLSNTGYYKDSIASNGTAGQVLSSTGTATRWINAPSGGGTMNNPATANLNMSGYNITNAGAITTKELTVDAQNTTTTPTLLTLWGNSTTGVSGGKSQLLIAQSAAYGTDIASVKDTVLTTGVATQRAIISSGNVGGLVVKGERVGVGIADPIFCLHIKKSLTNPATQIFVIDNNGSTLAGTYTIYQNQSVANTGYMQSGTAGATNQLFTGSAVGDAALNFRNNFKFRIGADTVKSYVLINSADDRIGIKCDTLEQIDSSCVIRSRGDDALPLVIKSSGSAATCQFKIRSDGSSSNQCVIESASTHTTITPNATTAGLRVNADITPSTSATRDLGSALNWWNNVRGQNPYTTISDERKKKDIVDLDLGLDFIKQLRPVSYKWKIGQMVDTYTQKYENEYQKDEEGNYLRNENNDLIQVLDEEGKPVKIPAVDSEGNPIMEVARDEKGDPIIVPEDGIREHLGLIPQDVKTVIDTTGRNLSLWSLDDKNDPTSGQSLKMAEFIAPIIKSIQEISLRLEALESRI